jgi:tetratricopeptide (TPR) repeat protein
MQAIVIAGFMFAAAAPGAQNTLGAARELYASAAYEDALSALEGLDRNDAPDHGRQVDEYRAFCLYALGRTDEAERVAESLIRKDPLIQLNEDEASPRIAAMFTGVRKRLLPGLIREEFRIAKAALGEKKTAEAEPHFLQARQLLAEAEKIELWDDTLADLRVLVDGFLDLSRSRATRPQPEIASTRGIENTAAPAAVAPADPTPPAIAPRIYTAADAQVTPPVVVRQVMPSIPLELVRIVNAREPKRGLLDVVIDERGAVAQAVMRDSVHPMYDEIMVNAAGAWKYRPAMKDGVPVAYVKTIVITAGRRQ